MSHLGQCNGSSFDMQGFIRAYNTYNRYRKILKRIFKETEELFKGNPFGFPVGQYLDFDREKFTSNEENLLRNAVHNPLAFVIVGQSYRAKCLFVNQLLGQDILPIASQNWLYHAAGAKFKHGSRPQISILPLHHNAVVIEPRVYSLGDKDCIDWEQEFSLMEEDLKKIDGGVIEITISHPILRGGQIILSKGEDNLCSVIHHETSETSKKNELCTSGILPLFVYTFENECLCPKEAQSLQTFLQQHPDNAIMFTLRKRCVSYNESENQPPGGAKAHHTQHEDRHVSNGDTEIYPRNSRLKEIMLPIDINSPYGREDELHSPSQHGFCELKDATPNYDNDGMWHTKRSKFKSIGRGHADDCVQHGNLSQGTLKLVEDLRVIGYHFACTCKGAKKQTYQKATSTDSDLDRSLEEPSMPPDSCTQTNPSYISLNFDVFDDARLRNFLPTSVFVYDYWQERLQYRALSFMRSMAKYYLVRGAKVLHRLHSRILDNSIRSAFQMSRDLMITPRRMEYAKQQENHLFTQLVEISTKKQSEIRGLISGIKVTLRENILNEAESFAIPDEELSFRQVCEVKSEIQDSVLKYIKEETAQRLYSSIQILKESYIGTLSRCLECLESSAEEDILRENEGTASNHLKKILHTAYDVELTIQSSSSLARIMINRLRQLLLNLPWHEPPVMDEAWRRNVASDVLASLDDSRLAKSICSQFRARLQKSHEAFHNSLHQLELTHLCRLEHTEEKRYKVAKIVAPHIAHLALESTSMIDGVLFGMPRTGREIGRGMFGVVYQCDQWSSWGPCAVKSVAPPDEKHANDLSLEFYYTRSLPEHPRIVQVRGSIVDESYAGGIGPAAVLLIMDRLYCDLHAAMRRGISECLRMQIAIDVVEGIRFLHSQGLVHRDIKLKNVLLDRKQRAKITDLGFCKPGAMISGSIVGTPVHMPPELFTGKYDGSVDVYAFGILFWYLCAGVTAMPKNFQACTTKDHLWNAVRRGVRPERLNTFADDCWHLMKACWHSDPLKRPLLGKIQPRIVAIHSKMRKRDIAAIGTSAESTAL